MRGSAKFNGRAIEVQDMEVDLGDHYVAVLTAVWTDSDLELTEAECVAVSEACASELYQQALEHAVDQAAAYENLRRGL